MAQGYRTSLQTDLQLRLQCRTRLRHQIIEHVASWAVWSSAPDREAEPWKLRTYATVQSSVCFYPWSRKWHPRRNLAAKDWCWVMAFGHSRQWMHQGWEAQ